MKATSIRLEGFVDWVHLVSTSENAQWARLIGGISTEGPLSADNVVGETPSVETTVGPLLSSR